MDLLKVQNVRGRDLGRSWGFVLFQDVFDKRVVKECFKVVLHDGFPVARRDLFYTSENVTKSLSGRGCECHRPGAHMKI